MPDFRIENVDYDKYISQVDALLQGTSIPYVDFNLCKENILTFDKNIDYADENHLSNLGAEKYANLSDDLLGLIIAKTENEYTIRPVIAGSIDVTYEIILDNEHFAVQDNKFTIPENHEGEVKFGLNEK